MSDGDHCRKPDKIVVILKRHGDCKQTEATSGYVQKRDDCNGPLLYTIDGNV